MSRALELLEAENQALRAQLGEIRRRVALMAAFRARELTTQIKQGYGYTKGDENCPFMSEAVLYNLFGKDFARTLLHYFGDVRDAAGVEAAEADVFQALEKAIDDLSSMDYYFRIMQAALPTAPEVPELDKKKAPPALSVPYRLRTPDDIIAVNAFYDSPAYKKWSSDHQKWKQNPAVEAHEAAYKIIAAVSNYHEVRKKVRSATSEAGHREFFKPDEGEGQ